MGAVAKLGLAAILVGPVLVAYALLPAGVLAAWPAIGLALVSPAITLAAGLVFHGWRATLDEPLPTTAAEWLRGEIDRLGRVGIRVAAMERGKNRDSFFHPASTTIVLADDVHGEHGARAHAVAAHELGHALVHLDRPRLSAVLIAARAYNAGFFHAGAGLLVGAMLVGTDAVRLAAVALLGAAMVLQALVVVDEALATSIARGLLRAHLGAPAQASAGSDALARALATYGLRLAGMTAAVAVAAWLTWTRPGGVVGEGAAVTGWTAAAVTMSALAVLAGAVAAIALAARPTVGGLAALGSLAQTLALLWCPLLVAALCDQPGAPAWTIALAAGPAWSVLTTPPVVLVQWLATALGRDIAAMSQPSPTTAPLAIKRIAWRQLAEREEPAGLVVRLAGAAGFVWPVPLACWWLAA